MPAAHLPGTLSPASPPGPPPALATPAPHHTIPLRDPDLWCLYHASLVMPTPQGLPLSGPTQHLPNAPRPASHRTFPRLCVPGHPERGDQSSRGLSRNRLPVHLRVQPRPWPGPSVSAPGRPRLQGPRPPASTARQGRCTLTLRALTLGSLGPSGHSPASLLGRVPAAGHPAQSCSVPGLAFLKHTADWFKKPPLHNQNRKRPFPSSGPPPGPASTELAGPPAPSTPPPPGPTLAPHSSDAGSPASLCSHCPLSSGASAPGMVRPTLEGPADAGSPTVLLPLETG